MIKIPITLVLLCLICLTSIFAQSAETSLNAQTSVSTSSGKTTPVSVPRFTTPPTIDGRLDDELWKTAAQFKDFRQTEPGDNIAPSKEHNCIYGLRFRISVYSVYVF